LSPQVLPQTEQRYSYLSPSGRQMRRRLRTGWATRHFGHRSRETSSCSKFFAIATGLSVPAETAGEQITGPERSRQERLLRWWGRAGPG
jgi:hypothetical protein